MGKMKLLSNVINHATNQVEGFCLIKTVQLKVNVKGADYLDLTLADAYGEINAKLWDYQSAIHGMYSSGEIIKIRATVNLYRDAEQLKIDRIRHMREDDTVDMASIVASAPVDGEAMFNELYDFVGTFENDDLTRLTRYLMRENKDRLMKYPAALKLHHATRGGLMYHTGTMLNMAKRVVETYKPLYPELSGELVYTGIILHDIAKTSELEVGELGLATAYTAEGQLLGHISMGVSMVQQACGEIGIPKETAMLVSHMLLSHHGIPEYGSPKPPMFPEAEIVSTIDMLDARMYEMFDALESVKVHEFSERLWALENRQLYRHGFGTVATDTDEA